MSGNISMCPNTCQHDPRGDHFTAKLLEVAIFNNPNGVLRALEIGGLVLREIARPPYFRLEVKE